MFKEDNFYLGLFIGALLPLITFVLFEVIRQNVEIYAKESFIYILCIGANALIFRYFIKQEKDKLARAVLLVTFIYAFVFFWFKLR